MKMSRYLPAVMLALALLAGCGLRDLHAASSYDQVRQFTTGEAIASQGLLLKMSGSTVVKSSSGADYIGVSMGAAANGGTVAVRLLKPTVIMQADGVVAVGNDVYAGASGQVGTTVAGRRIGIALSAATTAADLIEVALDGGLAKGNSYADTISEITSAAGVTIDGVKLKDSVPYCDSIAEKTSATGVTVDGVLLKDGGIVCADAATVEVDTINEATSAAGVTIDGVLLKDSEVTTDVINEKTSATGVTIDGCLIKDGRAAALATASLFLSGEVTGNGSAQNTAHGLGSTPTLVIAIPSDLTGGAFTVVYGSHGATDAVVTVTSGEKYRVLAIK